MLGGGSQTLAPKRYTLLLVRLADAVVTVAVHVVAGVSVVQVDVCGAVGAVAGAEFREVAGVAGLTAGRARLLQLGSDKRISAGCLEDGSSRQRTSHLAVLAALAMGADGIAFQSAGGGVAAGIHTFLQAVQWGRRSRAEEANIGEVKWTVHISEQMF